MIKWCRRIKNWCIHADESEKWKTNWKMRRWEFVDMNTKLLRWTNEDRLTYVTGRVGKGMTFDKSISSEKWRSMLNRNQISEWSTVEEWDSGLEECGEKSVLMEIRVEKEAVSRWSGGGRWSESWKDREVKSFNPCSNMMSYNSKEWSGSTHTNPIVIG